MKKNNFLILLLLFIISFAGCTKNDSNGYPDPEDPGIAIFSNTGNNISSCYMDNKAWRTADRITFGLNSNTSYEVHIVRQATTTVSDTLQLAWYGYFSTNNSGTGNLFCRLAIPKNFSYKSFTALAGQRLSINATNGYFATNITGINVSNTKGSGNIYFHSAQLDSIGPNAYSGKMSGLYDADFLSFKITKGRFDHILVPNMINF